MRDSLVKPARRQFAKMAAVIALLGATTLVSHLTSLSCCPSLPERIFDEV